MNWQYTDATQTVAYRVLDDGRMESCLVSALPEGTVIDPYIAPPPPIPSTVTRFQALAVLAAGGYLDTVRTYIATLDQNNVQRLAWENAADWERTSPTLNALAAMLGLTDAQVDELFIAASKVSA
jgi:hypothetical protein